jgi:hypothetical protein
MTAPALEGCLADRLADEIGGGRVVAALFSSFTFRREFFERVALPLVTADGRRRGFLPITVVVDRTQFEGSGWGYEVVRAPGGRRWHAKLIAAMVEDDGQRRTILAIGSGNLTRSGWERNLELFHVDSWSGWRLPEAVVIWLRKSWLRDSAFATWSIDEGLRTKRRQYQSMLGSIANPLWHQIDCVRRGHKWSDLHVVSPFGDLDDSENEAANACGPFFDHALQLAHSKNARLTLHLRGTDEDGRGAYGDPALLQRVGKHVHLQLRAVPSDGDRLLHAKLLAARTDGAWSVLIGSPNATAPAFVTRHGNVELACEFRGVGRTLPAGLLPKSRSIGIAEVVAPKVAERKVRWECLESATYMPRRKRILLRWKKGHGPFDSRVLLEDRDLTPGNVDLSRVADRFLKTIPRGSARLKYEADYVPIDVPDDEADLVQDMPADAMTADDWLATLEGAGALGEEVTGAPGGRGGSEKGAAHQHSDRFPWRERVVILDQRLRGFAAALEDARTKREVDHLHKIAVAVWRAHDPDEPALSNEFRAWRRWVRAGLWQVLNNLDQRVALSRPLSKLAARWKSKIPASLREFEIA